MEKEQNPAPTRGIPLTLEGKTYYIRYSLAARKRLIAALGGEEGLAKLGGDQIAVALLEGMKGSTPDLTVEQIEEMVDLQNLEEVVDAMAKAMGYKDKPGVALAEGETQPGT